MLETQLKSNHTRVVIDTGGGNGWSLICDLGMAWGQICVYIQSGTSSLEKVYWWHIYHLDPWTWKSTSFRPSPQQFEAESSTLHVNFLDVTVSLDEQHSIQTDLYTKPTDSHNYLNYNSAHPRHCRDGIPYSQFLRLKRICSNEKTFVHQGREMSKNIIRADYPPQVIRDAFDRVYHSDRMLLLNPIPEEEPTDEEADKTFLITTFHPYFKECDKIGERNWDLLAKSISTRPLLKLNMIKGNRRAKNLRDILVRARLPRITPNRDKQDKSLKTTKNYCSKPHCQYCSLIDRSGRITSLVTKKEYNTRSQVTCLSNNIVYCLISNKCGKQYVGQSKRPLVERQRTHEKYQPKHR